MKKSDGVSFVQVKNLKALATQHGTKVRASHEPKAADKAYATVRDMQLENMQLLEELASRVWNELIINHTVPK